MVELSWWNHQNCIRERLLAGDTLADLLEIGGFAVGERCKQVGGGVGEKDGMRR